MKNFILAIALLVSGLAIFPISKPTDKPSKTIECKAFFNGNGTYDVVCPEKGRE